MITKMEMVIFEVVYRKEQQVNVANNAYARTSKKGQKDAKQHM